MRPRSVIIAAALLAFAACTPPGFATYTITYHDNGASSGSAPAPQAKTEGIPVFLAGNAGALAQAGMVTVGWNTRADGRGVDYAFGANYGADADLDLYAKYLGPPALASVALSAGELDRAFAPDATDYAVVLADDADSLNLAAAVADPLYTVRYSAPQPMPLVLGSNPLTVTVSLPGAADRVYSFDVRREGRFVTEWVTAAAGDAVTLPLSGANGATFSCTVDWGDGSAPEAVTGPSAAHAYSVAGNHIVSIRGICEGWDFPIASTGAAALARVLSWGASPDFSGFRYFSMDGAAQLASLATGGIKDAGLSGLARAFANCASLASLPQDLFINNSAATDFTLTFADCAALAALPQNLFPASATIFRQTFQGCAALSALPLDLFQRCAVASDFTGAFVDCAGLAALPADLFRYNAAATSFYDCFAGCAALASIPPGLFDYNVAATVFSGTFAGCAGLASLPPDLFRYAAAATDFSRAFYNCSALAALPADLFRYNAAATDFGSAFFGCAKLKIIPTVFYSAGGESTRFAGQTVDFTNCFYRASFSGAQGAAPDLWACAGTLTGTGCFGGAGNDSTSLSNYSIIPAGWK